MEKKRHKAITEGKTTYIGSACRICGEKVRYTASGACQACMRLHNRKARARWQAVYQAAKAAREA